MSKIPKMKLNPSNLDHYYNKSSIERALVTNLKNFNGKFLDVGCGKMPYKGLILEQSKVEKYVGLDIEQALEYDEKVKPDFTWDGITMPFTKDSFDTIMATEVLEHCPDIDVIMSEVFRVLKPGGVFFFTIPFMWPLHEVPHDEYRYTPFSLERIFIKHGFTNIKIKASGGWNAALGQMIGLWLARSGKITLLKKIAIRLFIPFQKYLYKTDKLPTNWKESTMITGLNGLVFKK